MTDCAWKPNRQVATTVEDRNHKTSRIRIRRDMGRGETLRMTFSMGASRARMISTNIIHSSEVPVVKKTINRQMKEITIIRVASKISTRHTTRVKIRIKVGKINNSHTMTTTTLLVGQLSTQKTTKKPIDKIGSGVSGPQTITKNGEIRPTRRRLTRISRGDSTSSGLTCSKNMVKTMSQISTRSRKSAIRSRQMRNAELSVKLNMENTRQVPNLGLIRKIVPLCGSVPATHSRLFSKVIACSKLTEKITPKNFMESPSI